MKSVLVTGAAGFIGRNLCAVLRRRADLRLVEIDLEAPPTALDAGLAQAEIVFHLAGVNRPQHAEEYAQGNAGFTASLCERLRALGRSPKMVLTSSVQAELDNPYGASKLAAETLQGYAQATGAECVVHRLKNIFGKWCRPNYNSVTATFCHNIAQDLPIQITDPARVVELTYIDDVVAALTAELDAASSPGFRFAEPLPSRGISLCELARLIRSFREQRATLLLPDVGDPFVRALYATYLSYVPPQGAGYALRKMEDERGSLAEFIKSPHMGQIFVSRTKPGVTRGNHFHHTKTEKFLVMEGEALIRLHAILGGDVIEYRIQGDEYRVVDILPGYTHAITNVGSGELVTLFWSSELFDPNRPDTIFEKVDAE